MIAEGLFASIQAQMEAPEVVTDPPEGTSSVVSLPVFVEVVNWRGEITPDPVCEGIVCVEMTATPTLTFDPGDGSAPITCDPPGTRFAPDGADPVVQASATGACAHVYEMRTGVEGRPGEWPATVNVTWDVAWTSSVGASGDFAPMTLSTDVPRVVDEVQTIVVS